MPQSIGFVPHRSKELRKLLLQILEQFAGNFFESVQKTKFFDFKVFFFSFLFYRKVSEFIKFGVFLKVLFRRILGWIFFQLNFLGRTSGVNFHLFWLLFLGVLHSWNEWQTPSAGLSLRAFSSGPWIRTDGLNSSSKRGSHIIVPHCLRLLLPSPLRPNQELHVVSLIFFPLRNKFLKLIIVKFLVLLSNINNSM